MQEKATLMDETELKAALEEVDGDIAELTAQRRLEEAESILNEIAENHPQTQAGARARAMLQSRNIDTFSPFSSGPPSSAGGVGTGGYQPL
jgi:hypothetical protein